MDNNGEMRGKTYSLRKPGRGSQEYYAAVRAAVDSLLEAEPHPEKLLRLLQASHKRSLIEKLVKGRKSGRLMDHIIHTLNERLSSYTEDADRHLREISVTKRLDPVLFTRRWQYHIHMAEIELVNRIYAERFRKADYRFALIGHCLRDFRPACQASPGDMEEVCKECTEECFINQASELMRKYGIHPFISVEMDQETLFKNIKAEHPSVGALGIACVPELARGMKLCIELGIPPVGVPLDANRCARWMGSCRESSLDLSELEDLIKA